MSMTLHDKKKQELRKKIGKHLRRVSIIILKPFLPFIIVIVLIIFAVSTVSDVLFGSEDDAHVIEELSSEDYEAQYEKWLEETNAYGTVLADSRGLIPNGMFIWPTPGYTTITSHFGMRVHPISGLYKFHTGVDVAAPEGAEFVAMADGTVSIAKYSSSYGNLVMIDHGNGIATLYAHGTQILVEENQVVTQGTVVMTVGSTGNSTGPHAHFEVRINGNFVNPEDYFETYSEGGI